MEHREVKTPEQIAELKKRSPGGYRNLRESVINELPVFGTPTTATSGRSAEFRKGSNPNPVEFVEDLLLLRSPKASEGSGGALGEAEALKRGNTVGVRDQVMDLVASQGLKVSRAADNLMPTPTTRDFKDGQAEHIRDGVVQTDTVARAVFNSGEVTETNWGKFAPAIQRWESLTRVAPAPTKPDGKDGNHRLSAEFTEWMMGLPEGWVTAEDIGLKRNDQLKACGNGVVPQQAELALRLLLQDITI
jgi:DNA (cytosine-5)-methyltransferase 1